MSEEEKGKITRMTLSVPLPEKGVALFARPPTFPFLFAARGGGWAAGSPLFSRAAGRKGAKKSPKALYF
ncbi:MAG TPA: hypothetical protein DDY70_02695 [Clostridiales bacterium]|nr:hypothetical protein [Clostridiales bacterium]